MLLPDLCLFSCSLKFKLMYVEKRPHERLSASLPFGSAIHNSIARFYRSLKENGSIEPLPVLEEIFEDRIRMDLERAEVPIICKKETPDRESLINMGKSLLRTFHEGVDLNGMEIVDVELPLTANLYTEDGKATEFKLIGIVDLLLRNKEGELIAVENKTASKPKSQSTVDDDLASALSARPKHYRLYHLSISNLNGRPVLVSALYTP